MSLFVINRYEGEKQEKPKYEKKHLSELLKRIEERKKQRTGETLVPQTNNDQDVEEDGQKIKKRRIEKSESNLVPNTSVDEDTIQNNIEIQEQVQSTDKQKLHKKKKKKRKSAQDTKEDNEKLQSNDQEHVSTNKSLDLNNKQEPASAQQHNFMVLGVKHEKKVKEVKRVLPEWLANPNIVSSDLSSGPRVRSLKSVLDPKLIKVLKTNGIKKLFPVQASMISWLLKCDQDKQQGWWLPDTCVSAPTGSGKTLAYVLPIVQILQSRIVPKVRCLVVVPVQELAAQVYKVMVTYTSHTTLKVGLLSGASSLQQEQNSILKETARGEYISAVDIVVATPGRLIDHILKTPKFSLNDLRFLVIDEADRVSDWLEYLPEPHYRAPKLTLFNLNSSKAPAQKLLFSATLSQDPEKLNRLGLFQPVLFTSVLVSGRDDDINLDIEMSDYIGRYTSPEGLIECAVECTAEYKPLALYHLLNRNDNIAKTLIFTNSGEAAHRLTILLRSLLSEKKVTVGELSAQLKPKEREDMLKKFVTGEIEILISSDALARGIDVPDIQVVVSYDLSKHIKGYIHRAGRTGRAGKSGTAVSILTSKQIGVFKHMLSNASKAIPNIEHLELDSIAESINYSSHLENLRQTLENEKQNNLMRMKTVKRVQSTT